MREIDKLHDYLSVLTAIDNNNDEDLAKMTQVSFTFEYPKVAEEHGYMVKTESDGHDQTGHFPYPYLVKDGNAVAFDADVAQNALDKLHCNLVVSDEQSQLSKRFADEQVHVNGETLYLDYSNVDVFPQYGADDYTEPDYALAGKTREIDEEDKDQYIKKIQDCTVAVNDGALYKSSVGYYVMQFDQANHVSDDDEIFNAINTVNQQLGGNAIVLRDDYADHPDEDNYICSEEGLEALKNYAIDKLKSGEYVRTVKDAYFNDTLYDEDEVKLDLSGLDESTGLLK